MMIMLSIIVPHQYQHFCHIVARYVNVLTFGAIMTAYLVSKGMRLESIGIWRGVSSAAGLAGTFTYHLSAKKMSIVATGMWSILFQFFCISVSYASLFVEDHNTSLGMLIAGVCASRVGLWIFDLSITQVSCFKRIAIYDECVIYAYNTMCLRHAL